MLKLCKFKATFFKTLIFSKSYQTLKVNMKFCNYNKAQLKYHLRSHARRS